MTAANRYLYGANRYRVTAPLVVARTPTRPYVWEGSVLPADTPQDQIDDLVKAGMVEAIEEAA